jgi:hypothetical protein
MAIAFSILVGSLVSVTEITQLRRSILQNFQYPRRIVGLCNLVLFDHVSGRLPSFSILVGGFDK